ncbi:hypothetical protein BDW59DRAFT_137581 [Aspergillus cavernicola]|uniref:RING-type E3 ubiquitin transferase n=1 Tax=Aspergillus cavernicola TaxID=176166 RepID=A0ABR4J2I2_9EURO
MFMGLLQYPFLSLHPSSSSFFSFFSFLTFSPLLSLLFTVQPVDSSVLPSNNTADLSSSKNVRFHLEGTQVDLPRTFDLAPLTRSLVSLTSRQIREFNHTGTLVQAANSLSLQSTDIAFIPCDPDAYPGNLDASATVHNVISQQQPAAVLLYSTTASHCNFTDDGNSYHYIFTLLHADIARTVETQLRSSNQTGSSYILPFMSSFAPINPNIPDGGGGADSPNTAMIILYSITGIITALFLSIIITGAVRAHRHPERYGPRQRPGRPRQSRARGIARAMLETIPIVKFGDNNDSKVDTDKGDVEMSIASEAPDSTLREDQSHQPPMATGGTTSPVPEETPQDPATPTPDPNQEKRAGTGEAETPADHPNFSCPICTDDFVKGEDLRVLPCNHQFHPGCIDPWLVNVSGTCPLCRIDLNPPKAEGEDEITQEGEPHTEEQQDTTTTNPPANPPVEETPTHRHRRLSNYLHGTLNARRMRDASVEERLAALRSVREEATREAEGETDEQQHRRHGLTTRFRERFRIRTRAHGDENANASAST